MRTPMMTAGTERTGARIGMSGKPGEPSTHLVTYRSEVGPEKEEGDGDEKKSETRRPAPFEPRHAPAVLRIGLAGPPLRAWGVRPKGTWTHPGGRSIVLISRQRSYRPRSGWPRGSPLIMPGVLSSARVE